MGQRLRPPQGRPLRRRRRPRDAPRHGRRLPIAELSEGGAAGPRLIPVVAPKEPEGVVLVLHGGGSRRGEVGVSPTQLSVLRMVPIARRIVRAGRGRLAVFRVLNSFRGWDASDTPLADLRWARDEVAERYGERLPTSLVGHSLGGRAALLGAGAPEVRSVVALAPWVQPNDFPRDPEGRRFLIVHGSRDRIASPRRSLALAESLARVTEVSYVSVEGGTHAMLRRRGSFDGLAAQFVTLTLLGERGRGTIERVAAGERLIRI